MKSIAIYPGSFDPMTNGHIDILQTGFSIFHKIIIAIGNHPKKKSIFTTKERFELISKVLPIIFGNQINSRIDIITFDNLLIEQSKKIGTPFLIRGLRSNNDFNDEMQIADINNILDPEIKTIFFLSNISTRCISSTIVRQIAYMNGDLSCFVPNIIEKALKRKSKTKKLSNFLSNT